MNNYVPVKWVCVKAKVNSKWSVQSTGKNPSHIQNLRPAYVLPTSRFNTVA